MNPESVSPPSSSAASSRAGRGLAWFALWLAVLAIAGMVWLGWQQRQTQLSDSSQQDRLQRRVDALGQQLEQLRGTGADVADKISALSQRDEGTADQVQGMDQRMRTLESAVARLSEKTLSVHDSMVLDQVEALLVTARQRAELFHDLTGALSAYRLAGEALAGLGQPQLEGVRTLLSQEESELVKSQPQAMQEALTSLAELRRVIPGLTLKPVQAPVVTGHGVWARIWSALSHVVSIRRDVDQPGLEQDTVLVRQLAELDVVEAQAALLADDAAGYQQALQRLSHALAGQFDPAQGEVSHARASVELLLKRGNSAVAAPELGGALAALRDLRRVQTAAAPPAAGSEVPAAAASATAPAPAPASSTGRQP